MFLLRTVLHGCFLLLYHISPLRRKTAGLVKLTFFRHEKSASCCKSYKIAMNIRDL